MILQARALSFRHRQDGPAVVSGVDLRLEPGAFIGLVGANGSGKSTLVRLLAGLLIPSEGDVQLGGVHTDAQELRRNVGLVFQNPDSQLVATVVEEEVAFGPENYGLQGAELRERVDWALAAVRMQELRQTNPQLLSAGQKQRLAIAGVLAARPRFILLDEPTSHLDPEARQELTELLNRLRSDYQLGILYITHHLEELEFADRLLILRAGEIVHQGSPAECFRQPERLESLGLALPPRTSIQKAFTQRGWALPKPSLSESQLVELLHYGHRDRAFQPDLTKTDTPPLIEIENLSHRHYTPSNRQAKMALQPQTWQLATGLCLGIIGPTGSGKSTLVQHLNGLLRPQTGRVQVCGQEIPPKGGDLRLLRRQVGFLFQSPERQFFEETVREEVAFSGRNFGLDGDELEAAVRSSLERVGLGPDDFLERSPYELSGGERRLVALASVLTASPSLLVLDEPTAGLDFSHRERVLKFLKNWSGTSVIISHHLEELAWLSDELLLLKEGTLVAVGAARELFGQLEHHGFQPPLAVRLAHLLDSDPTQPRPVTPEELLQWWLRPR